MSTSFRFFLIVYLLHSIYLNAQVSEPLYIEAQKLNSLNTHLESIVINHSNYLRSLGLKYSQEDYIIINFMVSTDINSLRFIDERLKESIDSIYQKFRIFSKESVFNNLSYRIFVKTMHKNDPAFEAYIKKPWDKSKLFYFCLNNINILIRSELPIELDTLEESSNIQICDYSNDSMILYYDPCITIYHLFRDELTEYMNPVIDKMYSNPMKRKKIDIVKVKINKNEKL